MAAMQGPRLITSPATYWGRQSWCTSALKQGSVGWRFLWRWRSIYALLVPQYPHSPSLMPLLLKHVITSNTMGLAPRTGPFTPGVTRGCCEGCNPQEERQP